MSKKQERQRERSVLSLFVSENVYRSAGKKTPGGAGTHTGHTHGTLGHTYMYTDTVVW